MSVRKRSLQHRAQVRTIAHTIALRALQQRVAKLAHLPLASRLMRERQRILRRVLRARLLSAECHTW